MSVDLPPTYTQTFNQFVKLFKFIGLDFFDESTSYLNRNTLRLIIYFVVLFPFAFGQFILIVRINAENFSESVRVVPIDIMLFLGLVKITVAIKKRTQIKTLFLEIGELWPKGNNSTDNEIVILKNYLRWIRRPMDVFLLYAYVNLIVFEFFPLFASSYFIYIGDNIYIFPFQPYFSWAYESNFTYFVTYLWELISSTACHLCVYLPFDLLITTMTSNVSALFRVLQEELKNSIKKYDDNKKLKENLHVSDPESCEHIKRIVKKHQRILRLANKLSDIFGLVIFLHIVFASLTICFFGFLTVAYGGFVDSILNMLTGLNGVFTIFLLSLSGQSLCDTSSEVADAAYQSLWYSSDRNIRKLILFVIIRAQNPSYLSALGYSQLTLASFSKIMSSAWTYFSLLIQMYGDT